MKHKHAATYGDAVTDELLARGFHVGAGAILDLRAEIATLRAQLAEERRAREWRPIDSAPRMETILMFAVTDRDGDKTKNWKMDTGFFHSGYMAWEWGGRIIRVWDQQPTHWQPLPLPPASGDAGGGKGEG